MSISLSSSCQPGNEPPAAVGSVPDCIDLEKEFGQRWRIQYEESYYAQYGDHARVNDPWLKTILCKHGHIFPWGGRKLAAATNNAGPIARKLAKLPGVTVAQDGCDGVTVLFDMADIAQIAALMQPRRRRRLSESRRHQCAAQLARVRRQALLQGAREPRPCVQPTLFDSEAIPPNPGTSTSAASGSDSHQKDRANSCRGGRTHV